MLFSWPQRGHEDVFEVIQGYSDPADVVEGRNVSRQRLMSIKKSLRKQCSAANQNNSWDVNLLYR